MTKKTADRLEDLSPFELYPFALFTPYRRYDQYTRYRTIGHARAALRGLHYLSKEGAAFYEFNFQTEEWERIE